MHKRMELYSHRVVQWRIPESSGRNWLRPARSVAYVHLLTCGWTIDLMHWRHVSITTTPCWGSRLVALRARVVLEERWRSQPLSQCAGPGRPGGMACRGWPAGCMLGDGARDSASSDPQHVGASFCDVICIRSIWITNNRISVHFNKLVPLIWQYLWAELKGIHGLTQWRCNFIVILLKPMYSFGK